MQSRLGAEWRQAVPPGDGLRGNGLGEDRICSRSPARGEESFAGTVVGLELEWIGGRDEQDVGRALGRREASAVSRGGP
ncbi:MAG: hypothetical protein HY329_04265 [Chloroflexi bacterium]|nr:hypothetical protein [Chloroflexota bacterium]